jgi:hypothetical protein
MNVNFNNSKEINFFEPSNGRSIKLNELGAYVNEKRMSTGNSKLVDILIFDLPAGKTCMNSSSCISTCYAMKAQRMYHLTRITRETNLYMYYKERELLKSLLIKQISKSKNNVIRLHSSGDFISQDYINFWNEIIKVFPNKKFYAYTKVDKLLDFSTITKNKNFNLISSFINGELNYGSKGYIEYMVQTYNSFVCPAAASKDSDVKCGRECNYCVENKNVVFPIH